MRLAAVSRRGAVLDAGYACGGGFADVPPLCLVYCTSGWRFADGGILEKHRRGLRRGPGESFHARCVPLPSKSSDSGCRGARARADDGHTRTIARMGNGGRSGSAESEEEPGRDLSRHHAMDFLFHRPVFGCGPPGSVHGGVATACGVGRFQADCAVAEPASAKGTTAAWRTRPIVAPAIGAAHMAIVPRVQHRGGKLVDPRYDARTCIPSGASDFDDQPRPTAEFAPFGNGFGLLHIAGICGRYGKNV